MIACLSISYFATAVERRDDQALANRPVVVGGQPWEPRPLFGYSREVAQRGVKPGMSLRLAHVLSPHSHFMPATLSKYQVAAGEVVDTLTDFTHLVEPDNLWQPPEKPQSFLTTAARCLPARYYVDLETLPAREATPLVQEIGRRVRKQTSLQPSVGLAADRFTAHVAATLSRPNHLRPVESEGEKEFLAGQSISFLPLDGETARRLRLLGIRTLGQFAGLSQSALQEQFGADILPLYRLARGRAEPAPRPPQAKPGPQLTRRFDPPLGDWLVLQTVLEHAATELARQLQEMHRAAGVVTLKVETEEGTQQERRILRQPTANTIHLAQHLHALQEQLALHAPVTALTASVGELAPWTAQQLSLFTPPAAHQVNRLLPAIMARHKTARFYRPLLGDATHPLPECRFQLQPVL